MMPHSNCIQTGCKLSSFQNLTGMEPPKFAIGAVVSCHWVDDCDQRHENQGMVIGLFPAPKDWLVGWWYVIRMEPWATPVAMQLPSDEEWHEIELQSQDEPRTIETP